MSASKKKKKKNVKKKNANLQKQEVNKQEEKEVLNKNSEAPENTELSKTSEKAEVANDSEKTEVTEKAKEGNKEKANKSNDKNKNKSSNSEKEEKNDKKDKSIETGKTDKTSEKNKSEEKKDNKKNKEDRNTEDSEKSDNSKNKKDLVKSEKKGMVFEENKSSVKDIFEKIKNKFKLEKSEKKDKEVSDKKVEKNEEKSEKTSETEKPEYVEQMLKNKKRKTYIFICVTVLVILIILFSTIFALLNINNTKIVKGITVRGIDISDLSNEDAKNKITEITNKELMPEINLKYGDSYSITLKPEQIEFKYNIDEAVKQAYLVGRSNNIVANNYVVLKTALFGKTQEIDYSYNEDVLNQFIENINSEIPGVVVEPSYYIEESNLIVNKGKDGIIVEKDKLKEQIINSIVNRKAEEIVDDNYKPEIEIPVIDKEADKIDMNKIQKEIYKEPKDAYFETDPYQIFPDIEGVNLKETPEEAQKVIDSEEKEEYAFELNITKASKTIKDLGREAFPYTISKFSTKYDASNRNRSINLEISAGKINGTVLMPGEEFSYNKVVGKRTVEAGYKDAKIYENGAVVDGLAGGICQISSTLYNAVLLANLEITDRKNHSYTTSYVPAGRDATVVYGIKDFKFKNSRNYPIKIEATVKNGVAEFQIHGVQEEKEYEVRILPVTTATIPYSTSYVQDASLLPGQQVISQTGHPGYKVTTYKEVRYNGEVVSKEVLSNDTYNPMQTIIRIGIIR